MPKFKVRRSHTFVMEETLVVNAPTKEGAFMIGGNLRVYPPPEPDAAKMIYKDSLMLGIEEYTEEDYEQRDG